MAVMGTNVRLHLYVGGLLLIAYVAAIVVLAVLPDAPLFLWR
jgi:hypothetical protein